MSHNALTRILVVDDDPAIGKLLHLVLEQSGFAVTVARTGEEGLSAALTHPPDLAILDVMLPGMDGYAVCRQLRQTRATSLLPILMLTAQSETRDKLAGFDAGADDYVTKPFESKELMFRVKALLARSQMPSVMTSAAAARGQVIAIFGAKGGVGKTTLATNVAVALAKKPDTRVALVDADLAFGDVGSHLNLAPSRTILDLVSRADDLDEEVLRKVLIRHESGVRVLLGPYRPEDAERVPVEVMNKIMDRLAEEFDFVLVDCPVTYEERNLNLLERADQIVMILTPEIGPVKNTSTFLDLANKLEIPEATIHVVLNRANSEVGIAAAEIERALQKPIPMRVMSGGRAVVTSVNRGIPLVVEQPQHAFSQQVMRIADLVKTPVKVTAR
jgi:pilus assembly protein CpaE